MGKINLRSRKFKKILTGALLIGALVLGSLTYYQKTENEIGTSQKVIGAIIPHHLLVENDINQFYKKISQENPDMKTVILLSPNHFNFGFSFIQTTDDLETIDKDKIRQLAKNSPLKIEPTYYKKEHGIMVHLPFIQKYFPEAKIIPITFKKFTPQNRLDILIDNLAKNIDSEASLVDQNTLIIASIDFTHYEAENTALQNDEITIKWLENLKNKDIEKITLEEIRTLAKTINSTNKESVAFDSPESLYVLIKLLNEYKSTTFTLFKRTSSASLLDLKDPLQNTSHIFGEFN